VRETDVRSSPQASPDTAPGARRATLAALAGDVEGPLRPGAFGTVTAANRNGRVRVCCVGAADFWYGRLELVKQALAEADVRAAFDAEVPPSSRPFSSSSPSPLSLPLITTIVSSPSWHLHHTTPRVTGG
jgi:hypothetical protein